MLYPALLLPHFSDWTPPPKQQQITNALLPIPTSQTQ